MGVKKIAVIGAGVSGLGAIKSCLEKGLEPVCFENSNDIGGLWRYEETPENGIPGIYKSLTSNTSKEMTAFSDYPIPDHYPNYMHHSKIMEYLRMYARDFGLMKHIQLPTKVCSVRKHPDFSSSSQWNVVVEDDGEQKTYVFDGVMICSGHYNEKYLPIQDFAGITKFRGKYLHSWEYKNPDNFVGKRVVAVGIGNSGADVAGEISRVAEQLEKPTLAFIGILQPAGSIIPASELQSRWVVRVFAGLKKLPSKSDMMTDINRTKQKTAKECVKSPGSIHGVQYIDYMDEIASELGVKPNLFSLLLWDTKLAKEIFFGPCTPYQYRLQGPGKWAGARTAILTQRDCIFKPLRTRVLKHSGSSSSSLFWIKSTCAIIFLWFLCLSLYK